MPNPLMGRKESSRPKEKVLGNIVNKSHEDFFWQTCHADRIHDLAARELALYTTHDLKILFYKKMSRSYCELCPSELVVRPTVDFLKVWMNICHRSGCLNGSESKISPTGYTVQLLRNRLITFLVDNDIRLLGYFNSYTDRTLLQYIEKESDARILPFLQFLTQQESYLIQLFLFFFF